VTCAGCASNVLATALCMSYRSWFLSAVRWSESGSCCRLTVVDEIMVPVYMHMVATPGRQKSRSLSRLQLHPE